MADFSQTGVYTTGEFSSSTIRNGVMGWVGESVGETEGRGGDPVTSGVAARTEGACTTAVLSSCEWDSLGFTQG